MTKGLFHVFSSGIADNAKDYLRFSVPAGIGVLLAQARSMTKLNLPKAAAR
jgi:hypothetical protein